MLRQCCYWNYYSLTIYYWCFRFQLNLSDRNYEHSNTLSLDLPIPSAASRLIHRRHLWVVFLTVLFYLLGLHSFWLQFRFIMHTQNLPFFWRHIIQLHFLIWWFIISIRYSKSQVSQHSQMKDCCYYYCWCFSLDFLLASLILFWAQVFFLLIWEFPLIHSQTVWIVQCMIHRAHLRF